MFDVIHLYPPEDCDKGTEYNTDTQSCTQCKRGLYRDKATLSQVQCVSCPDGWVTPTPGADRREDCDMGEVIFSSV